MKMRTMAAALILAALAACDGTINVGNDVVEENGSAEGRSQEDVMSINAPGLDVKLEIPDSVRGLTQMDGDNPLLYPGASFGGLHVQGGGETGSVEMRFNTQNDLSSVAAWYRDAARGEFRIGNAARDGAAILLQGEQLTDNLPFKLRLQPAEGGGTQGVLTLEPR